VSTLFLEAYASDMNSSTDNYEDLLESLIDFSMMFGNVNESLLVADYKASLTEDANQGFLKRAIELIKKIWEALKERIRRIINFILNLFRSAKTKEKSSDTTHSKNDTNSTGDGTVHGTLMPREINTHHTGSLSIGMDTTGVKVYKEDLDAYNKLSKFVSGPFATMVNKVISVNGPLITDGSSKTSILSDIAQLRSNLSDIKAHSTGIVNEIRVEYSEIEKIGRGISNILSEITMKLDAKIKSPNAFNPAEVKAIMQVYSEVITEYLTLSKRLVK
jgi:hypothetical protein